MRWPVNSDSSRGHAVTAKSRFHRHLHVIPHWILTCIRGFKLLDSVFRMRLCSGICIIAVIAISSAHLYAKKPQSDNASDNQHASISGADLYNEHCAVCHGMEGKGNGPASAQLKSRPADLTVLSKQNGGKFPADRVMNVLIFGMEEPAHGKKDMPIWGPVLGSPVLQQRVFKLLKYLQSLQVK